MLSIYLSLVKDTESILAVVSLKEAIQAGSFYITSETKIWKGLADIPETNKFFGTLETFIDAHTEIPATLYLLGSNAPIRSVLESLTFLARYSEFEKVTVVATNSAYTATLASVISIIPTVYMLKLDYNDPLSSKEKLTCMLIKKFSLRPCSPGSVNAYSLAFLA